MERMTIHGFWRTISSGIKINTFKPHDIFNSYIKALIDNKINENHKVKIKKIIANNNEIKFILGPCQIESKHTCIRNMF